MISEATLDLAVEQGLIQPGQAIALRSLARQEQPEARPEPVDEEKLRFVTGFADIFVTIGLVLFFGSAAYLLGRRLPDYGTSALVAVLAWAMAEFFTRRRRMALPSITLLAIFALSSFLALGIGIGGEMAGRGMLRGWVGWLGTMLRPGADPMPVVLAGIGTAALAAMHYWRFRVPVTIAAGLAALVASIVAAVIAVVPDLWESWSNLILFATGLAIFALAMRFDLSDPARVTRRTDIAFWLHMLASPLIVHSVFQGIGAGRGQVSTGIAVAIIAIFLLLAAVAVLVDRRAMLVSGLVYAGIAFGSLIRQVGITDIGIPLTLLILGSFVLLLSAGWTPLRRAILLRLPDRIADRLPQPPRI